MRQYISSFKLGCIPVTVFVIVAKMWLVIFIKHISISPHYETSLSGHVSKQAQVKKNSPLPQNQILPKSTIMLEVHTHRNRLYLLLCLDSTVNFNQQHTVMRRKLNNWTFDVFVDVLWWTRNFPPFHLNSFFKINVCWSELLKTSEQVVFIVVLVWTVLFKQYILIVDVVEVVFRDRTF